MHFFQLLSRHQQDENVFQLNALKFLYSHQKIEICSYNEHPAYVYLSGARDGTGKYLNPEYKNNNHNKIMPIQELSQGFGS
ncbi:hypothetical protein ACV1EC_21715 [Aeromonas hydrophila]